MLVACLFGGAGAALADVLLSNIGSDGGDAIQLGRRGSSHDAAQAFTTGTDATGYTLDSIELKLIQARAAPTVTLRADSSGVGTKVADFDAPGTLTEEGINEFTPTASLTLTANTKYWIVAEGGTGQWEYFTDKGDSTTSPVDGTPAAGWSVSSTAMSRSHSSTGAFSEHESDPVWLLFRINGATAPPDIDTLTLPSPIPDRSAQAGTAFRYSFPSSTFVGPRGRTITYFARESSGAALPYWLNFVPGTRTFWGTPRAQDVGTLSVKVTASDGNRSVSDTFDIVVAPIARTTAPLVSNLHQGWRVGLRARGSNPRLRQRFTTGPNATNYTLSSVEVGRWDRPHSGSVTDDANTRLQVCPVAPTTGSCKSLTSPATTRHGADTMLFTASSGITLFPSATYDVVLTLVAGSTLWVGATYIGDDDADSDAGWAIHQDASASTPRVRIAVYGSANGASAGPTSADKTVSTATETAYVFSAADFPFTANTSGDTMASVVVATMTANDTSYDKGRLSLDGNDFETPFTLTKADLDAGRLVYTPWTDVRGGRRYARSPYEESFRFWVNGGTRATATHRMTIDVSTSSLATVAPSVTGVEIEPEANNASWEEGEAVEAALTFDEAVTVDTTGGTPTVALTLGASTAKTAAYVRGSGTTELVFGYTLAKDEGPYDSVLLTLNSLALNGGAIRSTASGADAALAHDGFAVIGGPTSRGVAEPGPTASFSALPERHDGESAFDIELHFSAAPDALSYKTVGGSLLAVTGGTVQKARRKTTGSNIGWVVTIRPSGSGDIAIRLPARACGEANAVCFDNRPLARNATATVPGVPFSASFAGAPGEHDGDTAFTVNFHLSLAPATLSSYRTVRDSLFDVTGARIVKARRLTPRKNQNWELTVAPGGLADVTLRLKATTSCSGLPGVCDAHGRMLAGGLSTTVRGPVTLSVADAQAEEGTDETIGFAVSLSRAASGTVTVDYATADGTATAGEDYSSTSGTLTFAAGETSKTVSVPVLDDVVDEGEETFTLRLSNATGARIADAEATGTVSNGDPLQKMWLSRFGRTVADHVVDAVAGRLSAPLAGAQITLAGQSVDLSRTGDSAVLVDAMTGLARAFGAPGGGAASGETAPGGWPDRHGGAWDSPAASGGSPVRSVTGRELLLGSSFHLALDGEPGGGTVLTAWGRATVGGFDGQGDAETGAMRMDGEVITGILGADAQRGRWLAGLAFSVSEGEGTFEQPEAGHRGTIESNMTSVNPYLRFRGQRAALHLGASRLRHGRDDDNRGGPGRSRRDSDSDRHRDAPRRRWRAGRAAGCGDLGRLRPRGQGGRVPGRDGMGEGLERAGYAGRREPAAAGPRRLAGVRAEREREADAGAGARASTRRR